MLYIISKKLLLLSKFEFDYLSILYVCIYIDQMIHVIRMHLVKFMSEHKNYMKQKNVIGVRIVLVILKEMHLQNMHSKYFN